MEIFFKKRRMKNGIIVALFLCIFITLGIFLYKNQDVFNNVGNQIFFHNTENINEINTLTPINKSKKIPISKNKITPAKNTSEDPKEKMDRIRKKLELRGFIVKGELHIENKEYSNALLEYLKIYKLSPNDAGVIEKIGDIYTQLKKFENAYKYYKKILSVPGDLKNTQNYRNKAIKALIYSKTDDLNPSNINIILREIKNFPFTKEELTYYNTSLACINDFSICKKDFATYFQNNKEIITFEELKNIQTALQNYDNFKLDDLSYKNALLVGAFFSNKIYPLSIELGKTILKEKPNYKPVLKIIAKSYFELGNYEQAKITLGQYNDILLHESGNNKDAEIDYFSGIVYEKMHDYVLSSIYLKNAINEGYENSIDARRRIIYNYYQVGETDKMLLAFKDMIDNEGEKVSLEDISLAIYYHITENQITAAKEITQKAIQKYNNNDALYGYLGWIQLEEKEVEGHLQVAEENLMKGLSLNAKNPMINFVMGKLYLEKNDTQKAIDFFQKTVALGNSPEFSRLAQTQLDTLVPQSNITQTGVTSVNNK